METRSLAGRLVETRAPMSARTPGIDQNVAIFVPRARVHASDSRERKSWEMIDDNCWCLPFNSFPTNRNYYLYLRAAARPGRVTGDVGGGNRKLTARNSWLTADELWSCWSFGVQSHQPHISPTELALLSRITAFCQLVLNFSVHL